MLIKLITPEQLMEERSAIVNESITLMRRQCKSNQKYAEKMNRILQRLIRLENRMRGIT